jgi:hypothetical protein
LVAQLPCGMSMRIQANLYEPDYLATFGTNKSLPSHPPGNVPRPPRPGTTHLFRLFADQHIGACNVDIMIPLAGSRSRPVTETETHLEFPTSNVARMPRSQPGRACWPSTMQTPIADGPGPFPYFFVLCMPNRLTNGRAKNSRPAGRPRGGLFPTSAETGPARSGPAPGPRTRPRITDWGHNIDVRSVGTRMQTGPAVLAEPVVVEGEGLCVAGFLLACRSSCLTER